MLKPDRNHKVIHYHETQKILSYTDSSVCGITTQLDDMLKGYDSETYRTRTIIDSIDVTSVMEHIRGPLFGFCLNTSVDSSVHAIVVFHYEVWKKIANDEFPEDILGEVEEIYYKGA